MPKRVVPFQMSWARCFSSESAFLSQNFAENLIAVHHIGSTSIQGMLAKPTIDILIEVASLTALDVNSNVLTARGYDARGEYGIEGRRYFSKPENMQPPGFHIHAYLAGNSEVQRHLAFRDYLRLRPELASVYSEMKEAMSDNTGLVVSDYQEQKKAWVDQTALEAVAYFNENGA